MLGAAELSTVTALQIESVSASNVRHRLNRRWRSLRVPPYAQRNIVRNRDATLPDEDLDARLGERWTSRRPGPHLDQNVLARYAAVVPASILGLSGGLFSAAVRPLFSYWAQTWHSKIAIRDKTRK